MNPVLVDARGLLCPWPAVRLARAARLAQERGTVRILADDPIAPREIAALCAERGWRCLADPQQSGAFDVLLDPAGD